MDGRVKTLHPKIHGGLLGRRGIDDAVMAEHGIAPIDLLVVNLYPFAATIARPGCSYEEAIENIDIGGPAMLRAAAKNHADVLVVVDPADYARAARGARRPRGRQRVRHARAPGRQGLRPHRRLRHHGRRVSAAAHTDAARRLPAAPWRWCFEKLQDLRYGENPHQRAAFYRDPSARGAGIASAQVLQGKELSFNNIADADTAIECVRQFASAGLRHRQARQPLRRRRRRLGARGLRGAPTAPTPPRPSAASSPSIASSTPPPPPRSSNGSSSRCWRRRACRAEARAHACRASPTCACSGWETCAPEGERGARAAQRDRRTAAADARPGRSRAERAQGADAPPARRRRSSRTCASPGGCASSSNPTPSSLRAAAPRSASAPGR